MKILENSKFSYLDNIFSILLLAIFLLNLTSTGVVFSETTLPSYFRDAEDNIVKAFEAIQTAEQQGVNVIDLAADLNKAIDVIAEAKYLYRKGDIQLANSKISISKTLSISVRKESRDFLEAAIEQAEIKSRNNYIISRFILVVLFFSLIIGWKKFKQYYMKKALDLKPEVL